MKILLLFWLNWINISIGFDPSYPSGIKSSISTTVLHESSPIHYLISPTMSNGHFFNLKSKFNGIFLPPGLKNEVTTTRDNLTTNDGNDTSRKDAWVPSPAFATLEYHFAFKAEAMNWTAAVKYCKEMGGHLAEPMEPIDSNFLRQNARLMNSRCNWWIGEQHHAQIHQV